MFETIMLYVMAALYILAGLNHFINPKMYGRIMPPYIPYKRAMVFWSGVAEVILGMGLLFPLTQKIAAWGIIALLIAVFPANIEMARTKKARMNVPLWLVILRLPLQFVLIWWAWLYS